jgi:hypothetical protein
MDEALQSDRIPVCVGDGPVGEDVTEAVRDVGVPGTPTQT